MTPITSPARSESARHELLNDFVQSAIAEFDQFKHAEVLDFVKPLKAPPACSVQCEPRPLNWK